MKALHAVCIAIFVMFSMGSFAQSLSYEASFSKQDFIFTEQDEMLVIEPLVEDFYLPENPGAPALPVKSIHLAIPVGTEFDQLSVNEETVVINPNCTVYPMQPMVPTDGTKTAFIKPDPVIYQNDGVFPAENTTFAGNHTLGQYRFITIHYCPFRYFPSEKRLEMVRTLRLEVQLKSSDFTPSREATVPHFNLMEALVENPESLTLPDSKSPVNSNDVQYLIITDQNLMDEFQPLADWKTQKGVPAEVISVQSILSTYSGATDQLKIKACVQDYYTNKGLVWVLLGGDNTVVPDQDCYAIVNAGSSNPAIDNTIPTDLFYCCFDNQFDWNADGDDKTGEVGDNVDLAPEVFIGRAPVQTSTDATNFVTKTLNHIQNPPMSDFATKFVSSGDELWNTWGGHSDADWRSENMWNEIIDPAWNGTKYKYYDTDTDFSGGDTYDVTAQHTSDILNDGYNYFWMATHGGQQVWGMESGNAFSLYDAAALYNTSEQGLVITMACNTNAFETSVYDDDPCLSEAFLRNGNGGAVLYHGSSRYGWGNGSAILDHGTSMEYARDFFDALFNGNPTGHPQDFAAVSAESKLDNIGNAGYDGSYRWLMFSINNMGDPEMDLLTQDPGVFAVTHPASVIAGAQQNVTIQTGVSGALVCLTDENTANPVYVYGYADSNGDCTLSVTPAMGYNVTVTVTAPDYKPAESTMLPVPANGPWVVVDYITAVTTDGDNILEAGESATIDVKLINFGNEAATSISLQLDKTDPDSYITITDNSETVTQTLNSGDTVVISGAFALDVDFGVYNGYELVLSTGVSATSKDMTWYPQNFTVYSNLGPWFVEAVDGVDKVNLSWRAPFGGWQGYYPNGGWYNTSLNHRAVLFEMSDFQMSYPVEISRLSSLFYEADSWNGNNEFRYYIIDADTDEILYVSDWNTAPSYGWASLYFDYPVTLYDDFYLSIETLDQVGGYPNSLVTENIGVENTHSWGGTPGNWTKLGFDFSHHVYVMDAASGVVKDLSVNSRGVSQNNAPKDLIPGKGPKYSFQGYNVYRDGVKLNTTPVTDNTFADDPLTNGIYEYHVTAVYAEGESCWSNIDYGVSVDENTVFFDHFTDGGKWESDSGCDWENITSEYYSAPSCYTDSPYGDYTNNMDCRIWTAPAVSFMNENANTASVSFYAKYNIEEDYDTCYFEVTTDLNSANYEILGYFTGNDNIWTQYTYDVSDYIGNGQVYFVFRMVTDEYVEDDGIYIDDFKVEVFENGFAPARDIEAYLYDFDVQLSWAPPMSGGEGWFSHWRWNTHYSLDNREKGSYINLAEFGNTYPMNLEKLRHYFYNPNGNSWGDNTRYTFRIYSKNGVDLLWESEQLEAVEFMNEYTLPTPFELTEDVLITVKPVSSTGAPYSLLQQDYNNPHRSYLGDAEQGWNAIFGNYATEIYITTPTTKRSEPTWENPGVALENLSESKAQDNLIPVPAEDLANAPVFKGNTSLAKNVTGYNIYRNGTQVNGAPVTNLWYTDNIPHQGYYNYNVTAVYAGGESVFSQDYSVLSNQVVMMDPPVASADDEVTLWFDPAFSCQAGNDNSLEGYGEVRMHSGIGIGGNVWNNTINWDATGANSQTTHLTVTPEGQSYITYTPQEFYGTTPDQNRQDQLCMVFNGGDMAAAEFGNAWAKEGKAPDGSGGCMDIFIPLEYRDTLFSDNFENGLGDWNVTGDWAIVDYEFFSATHSLTDSPNGNYISPSNTTATMANSFSLVQKADAIVEFRTIYGLADYDFVIVEASDDNFSTYVELGAISQWNWKPWDKVQFALDPMIGKSNVKVRIKLEAIDADNNNGIFIDDFLVKATDGYFMITDLIPHTDDGDGKIEPGESVTFDVVVVNGGGTALSNVPLTLTANDPGGFLTLTDDQEVISSLAVGGQLTISDAFALDVSMGVTNEYDFTLNVGADIPSEDMIWFDFSFTAYSDIYPVNFIAENGNGEVDLSWYAPFNGWYSYQDGGNNGTEKSEEERGVLYSASDFGLTYPMYFTTIAHRFYEVEADPWNGNNKFRYNIYDYATNDLLFESEWLYAPSDDYFYYTFPEPYAVNGDFIVAVEIFDAGGTNFPSSARNDGTTWPTCHSYLGSGGTWTTYPHEWMTYLYVTGDGGTAASPDGMAIGYNGGTPSISVPDGSTKGGAKSDIIGFNIYRDGFKINGDTPVDGYSYTDTPLAVENYDYYATAVYAGGESCPSNGDAAYSLEEHVVFFEDFENVSWYSLSCGWSFTTEYAYSGSKSIANAPWGNYADDQDCWFRIRPEVNLFNVNSDSASLSLMAKFDIQGESDTCFVELAEDFYGLEWQTIGYFTGTAFSWQQYSFDISDYIGKQFNIIFRMNTDESGNADGIYIDDLEVSLYDNDYAPPRNVEVDAYASDVHLKWNTPMAGGEGWFSNWSWSNTSYFNWGEKASYIDLAEFGNPYPMLLTKVRHQFVDWEGNNWNGENEFKIRVWEKDGQTLIFESEVLYASHGSYEYELSEPLELTDDVLVTIKPMDVYPTSGYMSVTNNTGHGYLGNPDEGWAPVNGNWATEIYLVYSGAKDNTSGKWLDAGIELANVIEPVNPTGKQTLTPEMRASLPVFKGNTALAKNVSGFNVYRDGQQVNTSVVPGNYYYDTVPYQGVYNYYVKAVYPGDELSVRTASTSVTVDDVVLMYPLDAEPDEELTLVFDPAYSCEAGQSNSLEGSSEVRIHSGVTLNGTSWSATKEWDDTGVNGQTTYLTPMVNGQYGFTYNPSLFYGLDPEVDQVAALDMVFNGGNSTAGPWDLMGHAPDGSGGCMDIKIPLNYRTVLFEDDFESGITNWVTTGTWATSDDMFFTATHCLSDSPWSWYSGGTETTATMASGLDFSGYSSLVLEYNILHVLDNGDHVYVDISTDDFATFTVLKEYAYYDWVPWLQESISLDLYENQSNVKIRFRLVTDNVDDNDGVFIDDVKIKGYQSTLVVEPIPYTQDFTVFPTPDWAQFEGQLTASSVLVPYTGTGDYDGWHEDGFNCHNTTGTGAIRGNIWSTNHYYWYNTPFIDLGTNAGGVILRFDMAGSYWNSCAQANLATNDIFAVVISTDGVTWTNANTLIEWVEGDSFPEYGETYEVDLSAYSGQVKFGFYHGHNGSSTDLEVFVDNVYVGYDDTPITIAEARMLPVGSTVCVEGIVTNGGEFGNIRYFQDATGGIAAYGNTQSGTVNLGDEVTYVGKLYNYNELLEISPIYSFEIQNTGQPLPTPVNVEPSQWADSLESHLMVVDTGYFLKPNSGGYSRLFPSGDTLLFVTPGFDTAAVYINPYTDLSLFYIPDCPVSITGILGQHSSDPDEGFQILPRQLNDFENVPVPVSDIQAVTNDNDVTVSWGSPLPGHNVPGISEYVIYYNTTGIFSEADYYTILYNEYSVTINDLPSATYYFWVKTVYDGSLDVLSDSVIAQVDYNFTISGYVTDITTSLGIPNVEIDFEFSDIPSVYTNADGYYEATVPGEEYIYIVPRHDCYSFSPDYYSISGGLTNNITKDFSGTLNEIYISGSVTDTAGNNLANIPVHFITAITLDTTTVYSSMAGSYSNQQVPCGWSGYVMPELDSYSFTPDSIVFENQISDSYNNDFVGTPSQYPVSGTITLAGAPLAGVLLDFDNIANDPVTASDGTYSCLVPYGWYGHITPSLEGYSFDPAFHDISMVSAPVTGKNFEATEENGLPPGWGYVNTGTNHTITLTATAPTIDGEPLSYGSWIGVFYMDNGVEKCAGAINWQGPDSPIIAAQGDDSTTPEKDGFAEGEDFIWKFYTNDVKGTELYATAVYSAGPNVYTTNGTTVVPSVYALTSISHTVTLSDGWSGISTYVVPENDSTELIFAPIVEDMVILKSMTLVYWPGYSNQIVHWNSYEGYKIKMELPGEVTFTGTDTDKTLALGEGWSLLPVLTDQNVEVVGFFAPVFDDLIIAKSIDGMGVYWPSVGVQTLQQLNPGESYMVKLGAPGSLTFPALSAKSAIAEKGYPDPIKSDVWVTPSNTGSTHTIAFNPDAVSMFGEGDYIGVFDMNDRCVGLNQVAKDSDLVISVYGDDKTTNEKDGMYPGERFIFRLYSSAEEDISEFVAEFDNQYHQDYVDNGLSLITKITSAPNGIGSEYLKYLEVYPNPATDKLYIHVPGGGDIECHLRVISANGGNVKAEATFAGRTAIDISVLPSGVYLVEITDGISNPVIKRVIKK